MDHIERNQVEFNSFVHWNKKCICSFSVFVLEGEIPHPSGNFNVKTVIRRFFHWRPTCPTVIEHYQNQNRWNDSPDNFQLSTSFNLRSYRIFMLVIFENKIQHCKCQSDQKDKGYAHDYYKGLIDPCHKIGRICSIR